MQLWPNGEDSSCIATAHALEMYAISRCPSQVVSDCLKSPCGRFPEGDPSLSTNVTVTITGVGPDYTSLGSFGTAEQFGDNLVASMDRSYQLRAPAFGARPAGSVQVCDWAVFAAFAQAKVALSMVYFEETDSPGNPNVLLWMYQDAVCSGFCERHAHMPHPTMRHSSTIKILVKHTLKHCRIL